MLVRHHPRCLQSMTICYSLASTQMKHVNTLQGWRQPSTQSLHQKYLWHWHLPTYRSNRNGVLRRLPSLWHLGWLAVCVSVPMMSATDTDWRGQQWHWWLDTQEDGRLISMSCGLQDQAISGLEQSAGSIATTLPDGGFISNYDLHLRTQGWLLDVNRNTVCNRNTLESFKRISWLGVG